MKLSPLLVALALAGALVAITPVAAATHCPDPTVVGRATCAVGHLLTWDPAIVHCLLTTAPVDWTSQCVPA